MLLCFQMYLNNVVIKPQPWMTCVTHLRGLGMQSEIKGQRSNIKGRMVFSIYSDVLHTPSRETWSALAAITRAMMTFHGLVCQMVSNQAARRPEAGKVVENSAIKTLKSSAGWSRNKVRKVEKQCVRARRSRRVTSREEE